MGGEGFKGFAKWVGLEEIDLASDFLGKDFSEIASIFSSAAESGDGQLVAFF